MDGHVCFCFGCIVDNKIITKLAYTVSEIISKVNKEIKINKNSCYSLILLILCVVRYTHL